MATLDAITKQYKQGLKDSDKTLKELEDETREITDRMDAASDAEHLIEDVQRGLDSVASDKQRVRDELAEATILDDARAPELKEEYRELAEHEQDLQGQLEHLTRVIDSSTVDGRDVAAIRARLRRVSTGGAELLDSVKKTVQADSDALRTRVDAVQSKLPDADDLDTLYALGYSKIADGYAEAIERNEAITPGGGGDTRDRLHRQVQRVLARA